MGIYDFAQLSETFQQTWAGLENVGGFNFVNAAIAHGGNQVPTWSLTNLMRADFLATPTRNDDVRLAADDFLTGHDAVGRA